MRVAFLFDPTGVTDPYDYPFLYAVFERLCQLPSARVHVVVRTGDLLWRDSDHDKPRSQVDTREVAEQRKRQIGVLLGRDYPIWHSVMAEELERAVADHRLFAIDIEGLSRRDVASLDRSLREHEPGYSGGIEVTPQVPLHWVYFDSYLGRRYRVVGTQLRVLHTAFDVAAGEDNRDWWRHRKWVESGLFEDVVWEDIGILDTVFDPHDTLENAQARADLEELVGQTLTTVANEVCLRLFSLSPTLMPPILAALQRVEQARDSEEVAQACLSFRRFMEALADVLLPPRPAAKGQRDLGRDKYKNRLAMYAEESLEREAATQVVHSLDQLGARLSHLLNVANQGAHATLHPVELHGLSIATLTFVHDLLTLARPPVRADLEPYASHLREVLTEAAGDEDGP
jgi:hypothetical protein